MYFCIWKVKTISVVRGQLFCGQCKAKFLLEYDCINDLHKVQSITDTDNEFTECQTPRKKLQSFGRLTCQLTGTYENFKEWYFRSIQSTGWLFENSESDSYNKNDVKEKVNDLVRLHKEKQEKLKTASYSKQIQILTLVPDKWYQIYC